LAFKLTRNNYDVGPEDINGIELDPISGNLSFPTNHGQYA